MPAGEAAPAQSVVLRATREFSCAQIEGLAHSCGNARMIDSQTYAERHETACRAYAALIPSIDPEVVAHRLLHDHDALGAMAFDVIGAMWSRPQLSRRDRLLVVIAVLAAQVRERELEAYVSYALLNGLQAHEIEEVLLHIAAYAGFPAAMASSTIVRKVIAADLGGLPRETTTAAPKSDQERDRDGADVYRILAGPVALQALPGGEAFTAADGVAFAAAAFGDVGVMAFRWAFGEIWARDQLSRRDRSIVVISILIWLGAGAELGLHVPGGLRHGLTAAEIEEIVHHLSLYVGIPRAVEAMRSVRAALVPVDDPQHA